MTRVLGREPPCRTTCRSAARPTICSTTTSSPIRNPAERRKLLDDAGDGSEYSRLHAIYHPLMRAAATTVGFFDFMIADPKSGRLIYTVEKEVDFTTSLQFGPYRRSNVAAAVARCAETADRSAICLEDFAPYAPSGGAPIAFMAAPVIDQGVVIGVLVAQLSNEEIDNVVTGDRRWRQEGFGDTGEAYLVGPDYLVRSGPRAFYENREDYFAELKAVGASDEEIAAIQRYGTPVLHQRIDTKATRAALAGVEGTGEIIGYRGVPTLASWGPLGDSRRQVGPRRQDRQRRGFRADRPAAPGPAARRRTGAARGGRHRRVAFARAARAAARAHRRGETLRCRRLRGQRAGPHARRDRPALPRPSTAWSRICARRTS